MNPATERPCEWCGHPHPVTALCTQRPKWSRRGFIGLCGAALTGALLPSLPVVEVVPQWETFAMSHAFTIDAMTWRGATELFLATWTDGKQLARLQGAGGGDPS